MASLGLVTSLSLFLIDKKLKRKLDAVKYEEVTTNDVFEESDERHTPAKTIKSEMSESLLNKSSR